MIIYFTIGLVTFLVSQFISTRCERGSDSYNGAKFGAWLSLLFWPLTLAVAVAILSGIGLAMAIQYIDNKIDRVIRKNK